MDEDLKAKAQELIENAPEKWLTCSIPPDSLCVSCYFKSDTSIPGFGSCISNRIIGTCSGCANTRILQKQELTRRETPEYKAQQALRAIPDDRIIAACMVPSCNCRNLNGVENLSGCDMCAIGFYGSKIYVDCKALIKSEYTRRFPNGHGEKGE